MRISTCFSRNKMMKQSNRPNFTFKRVVKKKVEEEKQSRKKLFILRNFSKKTKKREKYWKLLLCLQSKKS